MIAEPDSAPDVVSEAQSILTKVHRVLADGHTDLSFDEVLVQAKVTPNEYMEALKAKEVL